MAQSINVDVLGIEKLYRFCKPYDSARDLIDYLLDGFTPERVTQTLVIGRNGFVFRGHADVRWRLIPTAHRSDALAQSAIAERAPQPLKDPRDESGPAKRNPFGDYLFEEVHGVRRFLETADKLGLPTPINFEHFRAQTRTYGRLWDENDLSEFDRFPDPDLYPAFAMAQHYGVPTRFLDWTESPLVAAFFAAEGMWRAMRTEAAKPECQRLCVPPYFAVVPMQIWGLEKKEVEIVRAPRAGNDFLQAQQGLFTLLPEANKFWWAHSRWPSLHDMDVPLMPLVLPNSEAVPLLRLLFQLDITPYHLMPTLQAAAAAVAYKRNLFSPDALLLHRLFQSNGPG
jgi:hypothetical protein